ncbi:hypothetical protein Sjap_018793 [Stephania japonica]|uniref:Transmembrane protein n=1 Tax=Stephania japonica TaxID=461633 RepID=A0AAP0I8W6_9MAGN
MQISAQSLLSNSHSPHQIHLFSHRIHNNHYKPTTITTTTTTQSLHFTIHQNPHKTIHQNPHKTLIPIKPIKPIKPFKPLNRPIRVHNSPNFVDNQGSESFNFDAFLSILEFFCVISSVFVSIGCAVEWRFLGGCRNWALLSRVLAWQSVVVVGAVAVGVLIRRRQWSRVCRDWSGRSSDGGGGLSVVSLLERVDKVEEDLRSSATIIRVLSRQLEKLGIRFRVTRKGLKQPIEETAALAQKNSEATRALAIQEDILEKELGEIQKVLLAMQEQQQKQLELILAIGKAGKLKDFLSDPVVGEENINRSTSDLQNEEQKRRETINQAQTSPARKGASNDRP